MSAFYDDNELSGYMNGFINFILEFAACIFAFSRQHSFVNQLFKLGAADKLIRVSPKTLQYFILNASAFAANCVNQCTETRIKFLLKIVNI